MDQVVLRDNPVDQPISRNTPQPVSNKCPPFSHNNGLGVCVCQSGYFYAEEKCMEGTPCQASSTRQADGSCQCNAGLTNYGGICSRCPNGAIWS